MTTVKPFWSSLPLHCALAAALGLGGAYAFAVWGNHRPGRAVTVAPPPAPAVAPATPKEVWPPLPEDPDELALAAAAGRTEEAKKFLLAHVDDYGGQGGWLLAAVCEQDPAWLDFFLSQYKGDEPENWRHGASRLVAWCTFATHRAWEEERLWKIARLSPAVRGCVKQEVTEAGVESMISPTTENFLQLMDPLFEIDDDTLDCFCGQSTDPRVLGGMLDLLAKGHWDGKAPPTLCYSLAKLGATDPGAYQPLEGKMTAEVREQMRTARDLEPLPGRTPPGPEELAAVPGPEVPGLIQRWETSGTMMPLASVAALSARPFVDYENAMKEEEIVRHFQKIAAQIPGIPPSDQRESLILGEVRLAFQAGCDYETLVPWIESMSNEDWRRGELEHFAALAPQRALDYATGKMTAGEDRDFLMERAKAALP